MPVVPPGATVELISNHDSEGRYNFRVARGYGWVARTQAEAERKNAQFREKDDRGYWEVPANESVWAHNDSDNDLVIEVEKQGFFTELFSPQRQKTSVTAAEDRNEMDEFTSIKNVTSGATNTVFIQLEPENNPDFFPMRVMGMTIAPREPLPAGYRNSDLSAYTTIEDPDGNTVFQVNTTLQNPQLLLTEGLRFKIPDEDGWKISVGMINRSGSDDLEMLMHFLYQRVELDADDGFF